MPQTCLAAQLYTVRQFTQTPAGIAVTLKKIKQFGYDAVQVSGFGPIDKKELRRMLDGEGLACMATHVGFAEMRDTPEKVIADHHILGCPHTAPGSMPGEYQNAAGFHRFAQEASQVARVLREKGNLTWSYHNHSFELIRYGGRTGMDILFAESDPQVFNFEIDTYWITHGGGDPAAYIRRAKGRIPLVHFKDMAVQRNEKKVEQVMAEVGEGNLNWPEILRACKEAGVQWYFVEQDICQRDPFESLALSLKNLKAMGLR